MSRFLEELIAHADYPVQDAAIVTVVAKLPRQDDGLIGALGPHARKWWAYHRRNPIET